MIVVATTMPRCRLLAMLCHMPDPLSLRIDVDRDADPVSGRVSAGDGPERTFAGWTELFAALQDAINAEQATRPTAADIKR